jgi:hypothetical protein
LLPLLPLLLLLLLLLLVCLQALLHVVFSRHMEAIQQQLGQQDGALLQQVRLLGRITAAPACRCAWMHLRMVFGCLLYVPVITITVC